MTKKKFIIFIFIGFVYSGYSQVLNEKFHQNEVPKEQVYLHVNSSLLFTGEKLFYNFYCINPKTNKLSDLSKIGWVVLVNSDREKVFQHKLELKKGHSYSDFFIPSNLPSGAYKLLGYTSWMLNENENYFKQDIHILNPYQKVNTGFVFEDFSNTSSSQNEIIENSSNIEVSLNKNLFSTREEVVLTLNEGKTIANALSVSVRLMDNLNKPEIIKSTNFNNADKAENWNFSDTLILPELRGARVSGKIIIKDSLIISKENLIISFVGEERPLNIISIDEKGEFSFALNNNLGGEEVLLQLSHHTKNDYDIEIAEPVQPDFSTLNFEIPKIQKDFEDFILNKSIHNQIENAYSAKKMDRSIPLLDDAYFFDQELVKFNLDDYIRFPDVIQTFIEIIEPGRIKKNSDGSYNILVRNKNANGAFTLPALLIIDGVVVQNHDKLVFFDADRIQSISILRSKYFFGPEVYQGVVVVETKNGDFPAEFREEYMKSTRIITSQKQIEYYSPNYKKENLKRIPDYRYQLLWNPKADFQNNNNTLSFYTSDLDGIFEISIEGFTSEGKAISITKTFEVK